MEKNFACLRKIRVMGEGERERGRGEGSCKIRAAVEVDVVKAWHGVREKWTLI